jgi:membrane-associated protein
MLGYWLGGFTFVRDNIELMLNAIVGISVVPVVAEVLRARRRAHVIGVREAAVWT